MCDRQAAVSSNACTVMLVAGRGSLSAWRKAGSVTTRNRQAPTRAASLFINTSSYRASRRDHRLPGRWNQLLFLMKLAAVCWKLEEKKKRFMVSKYRAKIYCVDESYTLNTQVEAQMLLKVNSLIGDFTASHARGRLILWEKGGRWSILVEICLSLDRLKCVSRRGFFVSQQCQNTGTVK